MLSFSNHLTMLNTCYALEDIFHSSSVHLCNDIKQEIKGTAYVTYTGKLHKLLLQTMYFKIITVISATISTNLCASMLSFLKHDKVILALQLSEA